jgi:hypothetical protein
MIGGAAGFYRSFLAVKTVSMPQILLLDDFRFSVKAS